MLNRAEAGAGRWIRALDILAEETLYDRVRREYGGPLFACSSFLTDRLVVALLGLYGKIAPQLVLTVCDLRRCFGLSWRRSLFRR